jgi:hypothetical protein
MGTNFNAADTRIAIDASIAMNADSNGTAVDVGAREYCLFSIRWTGASGVTATAAIEVSDNGTDGWEQYPGSLSTLASAAGAHHWDVWTRAIPFVRIAYLKGSNTTGTFDTFVRHEVPT